MDSLKPDHIPLTETEAAYVAETIRDIIAAQAQHSGAVAMLIRSRGLAGQWSLSPDGRALIRVPQVQNPQEGSYGVAN
jgi:hypothetical protein